MRTSRYSKERLARLLRLVRPAPAAWVARAKGILLNQPVRLPPPMEKPLTDRDLARLGDALRTDSPFRKRFDADPVAAAHAAGMGDIAIALEHEIRALVALAEQVASDSAYRIRLEADPLATLSAEGIPLESAEALLAAIALPDEVRAKLPDVVAHEQQQSPLKARLLILLLGSTATRETVRAAARVSS